MKCIFFKIFFKKHLYGNMSRFIERELIQIKYKNIDSYQRIFDIVLI